MPGPQQPNGMPGLADPPVGQVTVTDFAARGWNPTVPDEQLVGAAGAPGAQFGIAAGAPFSSPDVHDVDFWNGWLNKRNGKSPLGGPLAAAPVLGIFMYAFAASTGVLTRLLTAVCNGLLFVYSGGAWNAGLALTGWNVALQAYFSVLQNQLFISPANNPASSPLVPRWWDGVSQNLGYHGNRLSPFYVAASGGPYIYAQILTVVNQVVTVAANSPASGLYLGLTVYLDNGAYLEPAIVTAFTTTGTPGTNYYAQTITLQKPLRYPAAGYQRVSWNAIEIAGIQNSSSGAMAITSPENTIRVMAVTSLNSGGQRASIFSVDVPAGPNGYIDMESLDFAGGDGQLFGTDLPQNATTWFITPPFNPQLPPTQAGSGVGQVFYQVPSGAISSGGTAISNPPSNSNQSIQITQTPNTSTWFTAEAALGVDSQGYLTGQVDVPFYSLSIAWQNFLVMSGDIWSPSTIYISAYGAPHIIGTQGGLDGDYIPVPNYQDGQVIVSMYVRNGILYIFKTNSVYALQFNGSAATSPFTLTKLQGNFGAIAQGCVAESDQYLFFLSNAGLCAVSYLTMSLVVESEAIRAKFVGPKAWNLSLMQFSQAVPYPAKKQIWFQAANAVPGDAILVYDWSRRTFWFHTPNNAAAATPLVSNLIAPALCADLTAEAPNLYLGDYNGQVWTLDQPGVDDTTPIDFHYETPWLNFGSPSDFKTLEWLWIGGAKQTTGTLNVMLYIDFNPKAERVYAWDMTNPLFEIGFAESQQAQRVNLEGKYFKLVLANNTPGNQVAIRFMKIKYRVEDDRL